MEKREHQERVVLLSTTPHTPLQDQLVCQFFRQVKTLTINPNLNL